MSDRIWSLNVMNYYLIHTDTTVNNGNPIHSSSIKGCRGKVWHLTELDSIAVLHKGTTTLFWSGGGGALQILSGRIIYFQQELGRKIYFQVYQGQNIYFQP